MSINGLYISKHYQRTKAELKARIDELEAAHRWIPVRERLPRDGQKVLCRYDGVYECRLCWFWIDSGGTHHFGYVSEDDGRGSQPATHWMPLPTPPEDRK